MTAPAAPAVLRGGSRSSAAASPASRSRTPCAAWRPTPRSSCSKRGTASAATSDPSASTAISAKRARRVSRQCAGDAGLRRSASACRRGCRPAATRRGAASSSADGRLHEVPLLAGRLRGDRTPLGRRRSCASSPSRLRYRRRAATKASWPSPSATSDARRRACSSDRWFPASSPATPPNCRSSRAFRRCARWKQQYGSLFRAMLAKRRARRRRATASARPRDG